MFELVGGRGEWQRVAKARPALAHIIWLKTRYVGAGKPQNSRFRPNFYHMIVFNQSNLGLP